MKCITFIYCRQYHSQYALTLDKPFERKSINLPYLHISILLFNTTNSPMKSDEMQTSLYCISHLFITLTTPLSELKVYSEPSVSSLCVEQKNLKYR